jgi:hypothetical protein
MMIFNCCASFKTKTNMKNSIKFLVTLFALTIFNNINGQSIQQLGPNYFVAGIPTNEFNAWAAESVSGNQRQANWCWAACSQVVLIDPMPGIDGGIEVSWQQFSNRAIMALRVWVSR